MTNKTRNIRIQAFINPKHYELISEMSHREILGKKGTKGLIIDIAMCELIKQLEQGNKLDNLALDYYNKMQTRGILIHEF